MGKTVRSPLMMQHRRHIVLLFLFCLTAGWASAQKRYNYETRQSRSPKYDFKTIHFGFELGINYYDFHVTPSETLQNIQDNQNTLYSVDCIATPGFTLLLISDLRLTSFLNLRFTPGISYTQRDMVFDVYNDQLGDFFVAKRQVESTFIEFPLYMKLRGKRVGNARPYLMGGAKYMIDMASQELVEDPRLFRIKRFDFAYEFGFGIDIYFDFFKFSPQIKASTGMRNMVVPDDTIYTEGVVDLTTRCVLISFQFE